jgi:beta-galactosidase
MRLQKSLFWLFLISLFLSACKKKQEIISSPQKIDFDWLFHLGDVENGELPETKTENWRILDLPHDWSIAGEYSQENGSDWQSGFLPAGIGWYRKTLNWSPDWEGKLVKIYFEGIYMNSDVWINGHHLGHRPNGYVSFEYDLTNYLKKGENIVAVKVDHSKPLSGRWYTGSGIYRHVWLKIKDPVHIANWGVRVTIPKITRAQSAYNVFVSIVNQGNSKKITELKLTLFDKDGNEVSRIGSEFKPVEKGDKIVELSGILKNPHLWSPENPYLYKLKTELYQGGKLKDGNIQKIGFRKLEFDPDSGFKLNGKVTKLKGVCDHHTAGAVGAAVPDDVWLFRLKLLKEMGCNAIRTSHNPFSPAFYNICDSLGLMVMNEFTDGWETEKAASDYGLYFEEWWKTDAADFIMRDRNHPSVIMWSIGNEVRKPTWETQKQLVDLFHKYDPTRPVTQGGIDPTRNMKGDNLPSLLDVKGFNGDGEEKNVLEDFHSREPNIPVVCTEVPHTYQTRGVYRTTTQWRRRDFPAMWEKRSWDGTMRGLEERIYPIPDLAKNEVFPEEKCLTWYKDGKAFPLQIAHKYEPYLYYQSSYDNASVRSSARKAWQRTRELDFVMGQFRWGSFDYLGETNDWPSRFANFGVIDICGFPKDHFFLYQSMWTDKPMVHILPHWTHPGKEGIKIPVVVYTNCDEVELFLNGKSLGTQKYEDEQLVWMVPYTPGTIKAVAKRNGKVVAEKGQTTAGKAAGIKLSADRTKIHANRTDVVFVSAEITDKNGISCPMADNKIKFEIDGPARIIGIDNGNPIDLSKYKTKERRAFRGKVMLMIQSTDKTGVFKIKAHSETMKLETISIDVI